MKIYFTTSLAGKKLYEEHYKKIISCLVRLNCKVSTKYAFYYLKKELISQTKKEKLTCLKLLNKNIRWCDVVIVEISYPSIGIGYEIALAMEKNKPLLLLFSGKHNNCPSVLQSLKEEEVTVIDYNFFNIKSILQDYIDFIKTKALEKRFTILLSSKMTTFLDKISQQEKIPRSVYIRRLIKKDIEKRRQK